MGAEAGDIALKRPPDPFHLEQGARANDPTPTVPFFGKALVEFVVSADGSSCGARLIYAAGP